LEGRAACGDEQRGGVDEMLSRLRIQRKRL
jgi:hypothetical protein